MLPTKTALAALLLILAVLVPGCGGEGGSQGNGGKDDDTSEQTTERTEQTAERTAERTEQTAERTAERTEKTRARGEERTEPRGREEVALEIGGDPGTTFSGFCAVGGEEEEELEGEVPASFGYDLRGGDLECRLQKGPNGGAIEVVLTGPGDRIEQRTDAPGGTINLAYSGDGGVSSSSTSSSSSGGGGSVNQAVSVSGE